MARPKKMAAEQAAPVVEKQEEKKVDNARVSMERNVVGMIIVGNTFGYVATILAGYEWQDELAKRYFDAAERLYADHRPCNSATIALEVGDAYSIGDITALTNMMPSPSMLIPYAKRLSTY